METIQDLGTYTFQSLLQNSLVKFGDRPALALVGQTPITYKQLASLSQDVSRMLIGVGLKAKQKVAIFASGRPEWGASYFGIVNQGMIAVPLLPDFSEAEVESILAHCGVDALIVGEKLYDRIKELGDKLPPIIIKIEDLSLISHPGKKAEDFKDVELPAIAVQESDTASIIYTSGTTGRSKGVELTHKNLIWTAIQGQTMHRVNKMDRCLSFLPLSHVYEFTIGFTMQMLNGAAVYYLGKPPVVSALLPAFKIVEPTIVCSVPLIMEKIYKSKVKPAFEKNKFTRFMTSIPPFRKMLSRIAGKTLMKTFGDHLVFFGIGGAKVDPEVERFMKDARFPYAIGYGLTETAPLLAGSGVRITYPGTIGPVMEGVDIQIANPDPKTKIGEVVAKGPNVMVGYYKDPELTKAAFTTSNDSCGEGYFKTGDLGCIEKKCGLYRLALKGRSKNMILGPSGENIYPEDIEFVLNQHPLVSESLVVEDDNGLVALVQVDEEKITEEAEKRTLKDKLGTIAEKRARQSSEFIRDVAYNREKILSEIQFFVNAKVNKSSHIGKVEEVSQFEKTASQKIKRYLYSRKSEKKNKKK